MSFARRVFRIAGLYGLVVLVPQYFLEDRLGRDFPPPLTHPEHFYGFLGVAIAWQLLFLLIASDPARYRLVMLPAAVEKFSFGIAAVVLHLQGRIPLPVLGAGIVDLALGLLFLVAFRRVPPEPAGVGLRGA